ncbi:MAG: hypothetical protein C0594_00475 [Marinilabiliales bacterium]|nr:MAG: hypothetical protein C0594_00475 [Marinilabiliales bacterium]
MVDKVKIKLAHPEYVQKVESVNCMGILSSSSELKLAFKTGGIIDKYFIEEGETVKKGQVLVRLKLAEILAYEQQAKLGLEKAERDFERAKRLYKDSVLTKEYFENAKTAVDYAKTKLQIAEFNLKHSTILAPENGKILKKLHESNEVVGAGYPVILFGSNQESWVLKAAITDKDIVKLSVGDSAHIHFDSYSDQLIKARITELGKISDPYTGMFEVELSLNDIPEKLNLISGFMGKTKIYQTVPVEYYQIPVSAMIDGSKNQIRVYELCKSDSLCIKTLDVYGNDDRSFLVRGRIDSLSQIVIKGGAYLNKNAEFEVVN